MTSVPPQPQQVAYVTQSYIVNAASNAGAEKYAKVFLKLGVSKKLLQLNQTITLTTRPILMSFLRHNQIIDVIIEKKIMMLKVSGLLAL